MADYIYTLESRLTPDQMRGVILIQELSRAAGLNVYLTGGAVRDILTGFSIRDLDFTLQGNPLKLQKELEKAGAVIHGTDDHTNTLYLNLPGNVRAEISMSRSEQHLKTGKPPVITPATITEDLRRRDFTINAMALSLNEGSKGLLQDPFNGVADLEAKLIRILQNYSFLEDPSRLIRATRFAARFAWPLEERTQQRFDAAKEAAADVSFSLVERFSSTGELMTSYIDRRALGSAGHLLLNRHHPGRQKVFLACGTQSVAVYFALKQDHWALFGLDGSIVQPLTTVAKVPGILTGLALLSENNVYASYALDAGSSNFLYSLDHPSGTTSTWLQLSDAFGTNGNTHDKRLLGTDNGSLVFVLAGPDRDLTTRTLNWVKVAN